MPFSLFGSGPKRSNINSAPWGDQWTAGAQAFTAPWMGMTYTPGFQGSYGDWQKQGGGPMGPWGKGYAQYTQARQGSYAPDPNFNVGQYAQDYMKQMGFGVQGPSALQRQTSDVWSNLMSQPGEQQRTLDATRGILMGMAGGGQNILDPLRGAFQANLADAQKQQGQFGGGPRFAQGAATQQAQLTRQMNNDWLNFAAPLQQQQYANQLAAMGMLGQLSGNADIFRANVAGGAGGYANALQGQQLQQKQFLDAMTLQQAQMMQQFGMNQGTGPAVIDPGSSGIFGPLMQLGGTIAGFAIGGPPGAAAGSQIGSSIGGGGQGPHGAYSMAPGGGNWSPYTPGSGFQGWAPPPSYYPTIPTFGIPGML